MPKVVLTPEQEKLLKYMTDLKLTRKEVEQNLALTSQVGAAKVSFTPVQQTAILANPTAYGLSI